MHTRIARISGGAAALLLAFGAHGADPLTTATNLYEQLGGAESISKMAGSLLGSASKDPRLSGLMGGVDTAAASPKVAEQICATLGGGCAAPYTDEQVTAAAEKLTPEQKSAVSDKLKSSLKTLSSNPMERDAAAKALGPKLGGILELL